MARNDLGPDVASLLECGKIELDADSVMTKIQ